MKHYSLSELCRLVETSLQTTLPDTYWVCAEISSVSKKSGHGYFELVEKGNNGIFAAKLRATCWSNIYSMLSAYFMQETGLPLSIGMQILVEVEITFHAVYGLSLNIVNVDPRYTLGDIARQRQLTIQQLQDEGIMDMQGALTMPSLPQRIAIISSADAAGYGDFFDQLQHSGFRFQTTLFSAIMQGDNAEQSILQALHAIAEQEEQYDAVVIIRGGGASSDLSCFDNYILCAVCAQFPLPVVTGIGHTRDISILDMVAHLAFKTPTAVAAYFIELLSNQCERIVTLRTRLLHTAERQILIRRHYIELLQQRIESCSPERIYQRGYSLTTLNGIVVKNVASVSQGQTLITHLMDGEIQSIAQ